jgi:sugar phosphate isomerase/epimerase
MNESVSYKRSVISDEISQDLNTVLEVARAFHLDAIEIRSIWDTRVDLIDDPTVSRLRDAVRDAGLTIAAVAPPFYKCRIDSPSERREHLEILRRSIDVAARLGTRLVRTFTFWRTGPLESVFDQIVDAYDEPVQLARSANAVLAIENEHACFVGAGSELARLVRAVSQPEARALWDPCNAIFASAVERPFPDGYRAVRNDVVHVHLKDAARVAPGAEPRLTPLGEGQVDVAGQLTALVDDGYSGFVSLETHWRPNRLDEATMRLPGGKAFSSNAAAATIYCLRQWDKILQAGSASSIRPGDNRERGTA